MKVVNNSDKKEKMERKIPRPRTRPRPLSRSIKTLRNLLFHSHNNRSLKLLKDSQERRNVRPTSIVRQRRESNLESIVDSDEEIELESEICIDSIRGDSSETLRSVDHRERRHGISIQNNSKKNVKGILTSLLKARLANASITRLSSQGGLKSAKPGSQQFKMNIFNSTMATQIRDMRRKDWLSSFRQLDPRWQIMKFFNEVAQAGVKNIENESIHNMALSPLLKVFCRAQVFSVWRPTSQIAIKKMMTGNAVGKGLDIKGKSAKEGLLSGYVPFLQIHSNEKHKNKVRLLPKHGRIRVFFRSLQDREKASSQLQHTMEQMLGALERSKAIINSNEVDDAEYERALENLRFEMDDPEIILIDDYSPQTFGLDIPERLFWEASIINKNIDRLPGTPMFTGRPSEPAFQDMNFASTRKPKKYGSKAVVMQYGGHDDTDPLCPLTFVMAYEEKGKVLPVVSDFDGFLIGTKGVEYDLPLPSDQIEIMKRVIDGIENILNDPRSTSRSWTSNWFQILKENASDGVKVKMPQFGYGDPKTYSIMKNAISRLTDNGAIRHGSECFNFFFPQELDHKFLVISNRRINGKPWTYLSISELQTYLRSMIKEGFTFPLNPKWILCDKGWKTVYDDLVASQHPNVQSSLDSWYPPESGIRKRIESIYRQHPSGFDTTSQIRNISNNGTHDMDLAHHELKQYLVLQRAKRKVKTMLIWRNLAIEARKKRRDAEKSMDQATTDPN